MIWLYGLLSLALWAQPAAPAGRRILAVIAVGRYSNPGAWRTVESAEASAREALRIIPERFGYTKADDPPLGSAARAAAVSAYLDRVVAGLAPEDDLIVYFAGHGVTLRDAGEQPAGYFAPFDAPASGASGLLNVQSILEKLDRAPARQILVILDACQSGVAIPRVSPDNGVRPGISRFLITSADAGQSAIADGGWHNTTLFSGALLELLDSGACDVSGDGYCTATELALLARRRVVARAPGQTPIFGAFGGDPAADFRMYLFGPEAQAWIDAKDCKTSAECANTKKLDAFLAAYPAGTYSVAARKLLRDRVEEAIRAGQPAETADLRLVSGSAARQSVKWKKDGSVFKWIPALGGFWMEQLEVSVAQYREFSHGVMPRAPSFNRGWNESPEQPMINVPWQQAQAYCNSLDGTLPTVEQWNAAARANKPDRFPWHDFEERTLANLAGDKDDRYLFAAPVAAFASGENEWQIRNLIGNVSEWTSTLVTTDLGRKAVVVGGSFADIWRSAGFDWKVQIELAGSNTVGFRCIVVPERRQ